MSTKNLHAFLIPPIVNVKSDFGVHLMCTPKAPMSCGLHISGFYLGKVRGILGDGNNEPYDDFTLPSGHVSLFSHFLHQSFFQKNKIQYFFVLFCGHQPELLVQLGQNDNYD